MSFVDDMIIFTEMGEDEAMARLNAWCAENDAARGQQFVRLQTDAAGGMKVFTCAVWAMAGNYFPARKLAEALPTFGWRYPESVVLVASGESFDDAAHVVRAE